jgi:dienelactone hydrolase
MKLSDRTLSFSADGKKLNLSAVPADPEKPATPTANAATPTASTASSPATSSPSSTPGATANAERIDLDLWHWKDEKIQPMQKVQINAERNKSYSVVYYFDSDRLIQTSDEAKTTSTPSHGDWGITTDDRKYRYLTGYGPTLRDISLINITNSDIKPILTATSYGLSMSTTVQFATTFDGKDWFSVRIPSGEKVNLTAKLPTKFFDEELDTPSEPIPFGSPQWTSDEKFVLIPDRHDIWKIAADGSSFENITKIGRETNTRFRVLRIDLTDDQPDDGSIGIDVSKPLLLSATNLNTYDTGFYRLEAGQKPKLLTMGARQYGIPVKAKNADTFLLTSQTFYDPNDYYVTNSSFQEIRRVTTINPKVREFNWGNAELVSYQSDDGVKLKGILIKPEDFDPNKQYPMMVYIYERLSQDLHRFRLPSYGTSINPTFYASNGYLVFMPDIAYTIGSPGQSAMKCVMPAIQAVVNKGFVKEDAIGIQGHSWGGYQIAYMITQTNRFKAAEAGAPVSNMISAYGGIRWGTGLPREFQYERTQSRIGTTLWNAPMKYVENSPIFMADRVKTPLLILHNDQDDAVPWYQGIEYYLALRRLGKECYLFNYNGEFHGLRKRATQKDYTLRMQQFFDHHLKGAAMPEWMSKGIPYIDRDKEKEQWKNTFSTEKEKEK